MATYLEELHQLFPNGLHGAAPAPVSDQKVELLIDIFDDVKVSDEKSASQTTAAAHDLVDAILYQIHPSLASKKEEATIRPSSITLPSKPQENASNNQVLQGNRLDKKAPSLHLVREHSAKVESPLSSPSSPTTSVSTSGSSRQSPSQLHGLAGKAIARKYDVFTSNPEGSGMQRVEKPILLAKESTSRGTSASSSSKPASPTSPTSSRSTSEETSPAPVRFISIAGSSARAKAQEEASKRGSIKAEDVTRTSSSSRPVMPPGSSPPHGRLSIFNKTTVRPAAPPASSRRRESSSESEESPRRPRHSSSDNYRPRGGPSSSARPGDRQRGGNIKTLERPRGHQWEYDGSEKPKSASTQGRYISSGHIVDRAGPPGPEPDFVGYKNGWNPLQDRRPSDGYVLGGASASRYNHAEEDEEEQEPEGRTPFHWTGDVDVEPGKRRIIGKGALGSRPGTFKSRSDERFAAATAALEKDQEKEYANQAPDPLENMHPAAASWEMQRRGILLRNDRKSRGVRA